MMVHGMAWWLNMRGQIYDFVDLSTHVKIKDLICPHYVHNLVTLIAQKIFFVHNLSTIEVAKNFDMTTI